MKIMKNEKFISIDPGTEKSAFAIFGNGLELMEFGKKENSEILEIIRKSDAEILAIEAVASYGMPVGAEVFETCYFIGMAMEAAFKTNKKVCKIYRKDEKLNLCGSLKANDATIRQALIDRFGGKGTKKNPGYFYGVKGDVWQAIAVGVTFYDMKKRGELNE